MKIFNNGTVLGMILVAAFAADAALAQDTQLQPESAAFISEIHADIKAQQAAFIRSHAIADTQNIASDTRSASQWKNAIYFPIVPEKHRAQL